MEIYQHFSATDLISDVMEHPAFGGRGRLLFPWDDDSRYGDNMTMQDAPSLHLWHTNMDVKEMVDGVNRMIDDVGAGHQVFYDMYSEKEKAADSSKEDTGLFFFRGEPGAPFAIIGPGGGFYYVGSLHEGFPLAVEINRHGYNAFVLNYRVGQGETVASRDLIAATNFVRQHADELGVNPDGYSLWGSSAGARMCSNASYGEGGLTRRDDLLHPAANIIAYTYFAGDPAFTSGDSAAYFVVGTEDWIVPWREVEERAEEMKTAGVPVECHILENTQHGFGVGAGTPAEGWMDQAITFWEGNMPVAISTSNAPSPGTYQTRELYCQNGDNRIYGVAYIPDGTGPFPTMIYSHGYGYNHEPYELSRLAEQGIAVYRFDFCGGSAASRSDGKSTEMSVVTEASDLNTVIDMLKEQDFVDENNLFLCGGSQGGYVSTLVAAQRPEEIRGMILMCPAYVINDNFRSQYRRKADIPDTFRFSNMLLGRVYVEDVWDIDIYETMAGYPKDVLLFHGDADDLVPLRYSQRALEAFPAADLIVLPGAGHTPGWSHEDEIIKNTMDFIHARVTNREASQ